MRVRLLFPVLLACLALPAFVLPVIAAPAAGLVPSPPTSVLFYPEEAQLTVEESLTPVALPGGGMGFRLVVPADAERATFFAVVGGASVSGIVWEEPEEHRRPPLRAGQQQPENTTARNPHTGEATALNPEDEPLPERRALLEKMAAVRREMAQIQGEIQVVDARLSMWAASGEPRAPLSVEDRLKLDSALTQQLPPLHQMRDKAAVALARAEERLKQITADLETFDEAHQFVHVILPFAGKVQGPVALRYGYIVPASSVASYNVSAFPADGKVTIEQFATLEQRSGAEWKDVDVALATMPRNERLTPFSLQPWRLSLHEVVAAAPVAERKRMAAPAQAMELHTGSGQEPQPEEWSTFRLWRLGKKTLASGAPARISLASDTHAASFFYTLRPALGPEGFLTAEVVFPKAAEMPEGIAQFFVDGVGRGEQRLTLAGEKATLFFGTDPLVSAVMTNLASTSGEQGLIRREKTFLKDWEITVRNGRNRPVDVRVEDAVPVATAESIAVKVTSTPSPEETMSTPPVDEIAVGMAVPTKVFRWKAALGSGESLVIRHRVDVSFPTDRILQPGR